MDSNKDLGSKEKITTDRPLKYFHRILSEKVLGQPSRYETIGHEELPLELEGFPGIKPEDNPCDPKKWFLTEAELYQRNWKLFNCNHAYTSLNLVTPLIDGESYMIALHNCLNEMRKQDYINIVGWNIAKGTQLLGRRTETKFVDLLALCGMRGITIRVLVNDFYHLLKALKSLAPFYQNEEFIKSLLEMTEGYDTVEAFVDNRYILPQEGVFPIGSHHQKAVILTAKNKCVAFVGGIDIGDDRFDSPEHLSPKQNPQREKVYMAGWHDIQLKVQGSATQQIWANFVERWNDSTAPNSNKPSMHPKPIALEEMPPVKDCGSHHVQVLRTFACPRNSSYPSFPFLQGGEQTVRAGLIKAIRRAQCYIYIEDQYFWASELLDEIAKTNPRVKIILVLSRDMDVPGYGKWQSEVRADAFAKINSNGHGVNRVFAYHLQHVDKKSVIYVHSKLMIIDDRYVSVGSANIAYRSTTTDTELTLAVVDAQTTANGKMDYAQQERCVFARDLRMTLWAEHLNVRKELLDDPIDALSNHWPKYEPSPKKPARKHHVVCHYPGVDASKRYKNLKPNSILNPELPSYYCPPSDVPLDE